MNAVLKTKREKEEIFYPESDGKPMGETDFHIQTITYLYQALNAFFSNKSDVKILADIMIYYEEGSPHKVFSSDVAVVKGVGKHLRRSYKLWEEKQFPQVVFEISSRATWGDDLNKKWYLYQKFGVKEYYIFDPEYDYLPEPLIAYRLKKDELRQVKVKNGKIFSDELGLEIVDTGKGLRLYDPQAKEFIKTLEEERNARLEADEEIKRLREEIERLKKK